VSHRLRMSNRWVKLHLQNCRHYTVCTVHVGLSKKCCPSKELRDADLELYPPTSVQRFFLNKRITTMLIH
jgi:hypothetical protein